MITRLPKWIEYGAFLLAGVAGYINAIGLLGFEHQSVSHLSGNATQLGTQLYAGALSQVIEIAGMLFAFFAGATLSGLLLYGATLQLGRHYDLALIIECLLLCLAAYLLSDSSYYGQLAASAACGLQNAMVTTYSGAVVRTTHLTGIFTDLGIMLGSALRGKGFDRRKAILFLLIISGFILGGTVGAAQFARFKFDALFAPAIVCLILALSYRIYSKIAMANAVKAEH